MRIQLPLFALVLGLALSLGAPTAQATPFTIALAGVVTVDGTGGVVPPPTPFDLDLLVDDATPDEDGTAGIYSATGPGTAESFLIVAVLGPIFAVDANSTTGDWSATGELVALGTFVLPFTVTLSGTGLTPDQILPDFTPGSFTGEIVVDITSLLGLLPGATGTEVRADITAISLVPEPMTSTLLVMATLGLAATAGRRRA